MFWQTSEAITNSNL